VVGRALDPAIDALIVTRAVAIVFSIGFIVLALITDDVSEREAVMRGDVVDARPRRAAMMLEDVGGTGHPRRHLADEPALAAPVAPQCAAEGIVPFRPFGRKGAQPVAARTDVPGLGNELHFCEYRVALDRLEKFRMRVKAIRVARERCCKIKPEAVHVAALDPITQRIYDHGRYHRMRQVERIAAAGEILVEAR